MTDIDDKIAYLAQWAARYDLALKLEGEVGFGRECVGISDSTCYVDFAHLWAEYPDTEFWTPDDAYHKHPCLAVLGRGADAIGQLYEWVRWLDAHDWTVEFVDRRPDGMLDAMLHGFRTPRLVKRETAPGSGDEAATP